MNAVSRVSLATLLIAAAPLCGNAEDVAAECFAKEVEAHVTQQFGIYGPQSANHEYFAFIYRHEGHDRQCCDTQLAMQQIGKVRRGERRGQRADPSQGAGVGRVAHPSTHSGFLEPVRGRCPRGAQQPSHPLLFRVLQQAHGRDLRLGFRPDLRTDCDGLAGTPRKLHGAGGRNRRYRKRQHRGTWRRIRTAIARGAGAGSPTDEARDVPCD